LRSLDLDSERERDMQLGLIMASWTGGAALLVRAALVVALVCCLAAPLVSRMCSLRARPGPEDPVDLDVLWQRYKRGEISWDDYLRGEVEGVRGLVGTRAEPPKAESFEGSLEESTSDDSPFS
jgi:hypothetical protein